MKALLSFILALTTTLAFAQTDVYLNIDHFLGNQPFGKQQASSNDLGESFNLSRLEYYISEITLIHDGGMKTSITDKYLLIDPTDSTHVFLGSLNITNLEGVQFGIGVDPSRNNSDPSTYPANHPLAPKWPSMHWGWAAGYRFLAIEGKAGANMSQTFEIHALDNTNYFKQTIPTAGVITGGELHVMLTADYNKILSNISISGGLIMHGSTGAAVTSLENFSWKVFKSSEGNQAMNSAELEQEAITFGPNPSAGNTVRINGFEEDMAYQIFDITGKRVLNGSSEIISVQDLQNGVYFLVLTHNGQPLQTDKLIINK